MENARAFAGDVINSEIDGKTVFQMIEEAQSTNPEFAAVKKMFGQTYFAQGQAAEKMSDDARTARLAKEQADALAKAFAGTGVRPPGPGAMPPPGFPMQ